MDLSEAGCRRCEQDEWLLSSAIIRFLEEDRRCRMCVVQSNEDTDYPVKGSLRRGKEFRKGGGKREKFDLASAGFGLKRGARTNPLTIGQIK